MPDEAVWALAILEGRIRVSTRVQGQWDVYTDSGAVWFCASPARAVAVLRKYSKEYGPPGSEPVSIATGHWRVETGID